MPGDVLDEELAAGIKKAKRAPCNFALIAKGPKPVKLIVRKKPILEGELNKAKAEFKGNDITVGVVRTEGAEYIFESLDEPPSKPQAIKEFVAEQTELTIKIQLKKVDALTSVTEAESEGESSESEETSGSPPPPPPEDPRKNELTTRLKGLLGSAQQVLSVAPNAKAEILRQGAAIKETLANSAWDKAAGEMDVFANFLKSVISPPTDLPPPLPTSPPEPPKTSSGPPEPPKPRTGPPEPPKSRSGPPEPPKTSGGPPLPPNPTTPQGKTTGTPGSTSPVVKDLPPMPGLKKPKLPDKLPGVHFRRTGAPLFSLSTGPKTPDQIEADKFIEEHLEEIFGAPKDPGSAGLDSWNDILTTKGVNDAETMKSNTSAKELNCSFCTIGALLGKSSSEISVERQKKAGVTDPNPKLQEMTIWGNPTDDPSKSVAATSDFNAQISPMKEMAQAFVDDSGGKYELVDSLNLKDESGVMVPETFDEADLIRDMKKLPNGTRYSVYMKGKSPEQSHWCYAEKRNDFIIFRDYQQSVQVPAGRGTEAFVTGPGITVDQLPLGPRVGDRIFVSGTFFAIKPKI